MEIISDLILGSVLAVATGGGAVFLGKIQTVAKEARDGVISLTEKVEGHQKYIKFLAQEKDIFDEIDLILRDAYFYVSEDAKTMVLLNTFGELAKECSSWAYGVGLHNASCKEIKAKFETCSEVIRTRLENFDPEFRNLVREKLKTRADAHVDEVINIATDNMLNSKDQRFRVATLGLLHDIIGIVVRARAKFNNNV